MRCLLMLCCLCWGGVVAWGLITPKDYQYEVQWDAAVSRALEPMQAGKWAAALKLFSAARAVAEHFDADDDRLPVTLSFLAYCQQCAGKPALARPLADQAYQLITAMHGLNTQNRLITLYNVGYVYLGAKGAPVDPVFLTLFDAGTSYIGTHEVWYTDEFLLAARTLRNAGRYDLAEQSAQLAVQIAAHNPYDTAIEMYQAMGKLLGLYLEEGKYRDAEGVARRCVQLDDPVRKHTDHRRLLDSLCTLAEMQYRAGDHSEVAATVIHLHELIDVKKRREIHQWNRARYALGLAEVAQGQTEQALALGRELAASGQEGYAKDTSTLVYGLTVIAAAQAGKTDADAEVALAQAVPLAETTFGKDDPRLLDLLQLRAGIQSRLGKTAAAEVDYKRLLMLLERHTTPTHPARIVTLKNYAALLRKLHRDDEAEKLEAQAKS